MDAVAKQEPEKFYCPSCGHHKPIALKRRRSTGNKTPICAPCKEAVAKLKAKAK